MQRHTAVAVHLPVELAKADSYCVILILRSPTHIRMIVGMCFLFRITISIQSKSASNKLWSHPPIDCLHQYGYPKLRLLNIPPCCECSQLMRWVSTTILRLVRLSKEAFQRSGPKIDAQATVDVIEIRCWPLSVSYSRARCFWYEFIIHRSYIRRYVEGMLKHP